jgi:hypothetical protein
LEVSGQLVQDEPPQDDVGATDRLIGLKGLVSICVEKNDEEEEARLRPKARSLVWAKAQRAARLFELR